MYSFLPQILILLSIAGIIAIILRRTPEVTDIVRRGKARELPGQAAGFIRNRLGSWFVSFLKRIWRLILEVKSVSRPVFTRQNFLEKFKRATSHLPKTNLKIFKSPDSPEFYLTQAEESLDQEDYEEAERKFIKVIEKDPKNEAAFVGLGRLYMARRNFDEAVETYKFLVRLNATNDNYYSRLGQAYNNLKLYDQAIEAYEKAIELVPENPSRYINLGQTLEANRHLEEAILNYRRAVDMEKDNPQFLLVLAEALAKKGEKEEAEVLLEQILQLEPTNHLAREKLMQLKF